MSWISQICIIFLCLINGAQLFGQSIPEREQLSAAFDLFPSREDYSQETEAPESEFSWAFGKLFLFYKKFISSQDSGACAFHPSCSVYAIRSVRKNGVIKGLVQSFDRLTRCNPGAKGHYPLHAESQKLYDPVK
jgi:putative membrane protein insertion efficiency factor